MSRTVLPENALNGGFPEPSPTLAVRTIEVVHENCGATTRVRLPAALPGRAVRRFHCAGCAAAFQTLQVRDRGVRPGAPQAEAVVPEWAEALSSEIAELETVERREAPRPQKPKRSRIAVARAKLNRVGKASKAKPDAEKAREAKALAAAQGAGKARPRKPKLDPGGRAWKLLSIPLAAALVIVVLMQLRGGSDEPTSVASPVATPTASENAGKGDEKVGDGKDSSSSKTSKDTEFVRESTYSLALPAGWERIDPPTGATFAAVAADGEADATLWITKDPKLDYPTFVSQSLSQLETLAGSARIVERTPAPTAEGTIVRLAADAPDGQPTYEVVLRVAGPYRYYLATTVQPGAPGDAIDGADLISGSLTPELEG